MVVTLLERYVFSIAFLGSLLFSGGCGPWHSACSTGRQARCWFLEEKAVACSYLGRAAALCRLPKAHSRVAWLSQIQDMPLSCWDVWGILGREGILVAAAPAKLRLALSRFPQRTGWAGCSPLHSPGLPAGRKTSHQPAERSSCKIQAAGQQHPQDSSDLIGTRGSPENRPQLPKWHIQPSHFVSSRGAAATQAVPACKQQAITTSWDPRSPHFSPKSGRCVCRKQPLLTSGSCGDQNHTWFFPLPLEAALHHLRTFHNRSVLNKKGNTLKILGGADFSIAQCTWPSGVVCFTAPVYECRQQLEFIRLETNTSAHPTLGLRPCAPSVPKQGAICDFDSALQWRAPEWEIRLSKWNISQ